MHAGKLVDRRASETSGARSGHRSSASAASHRRAASLLKILQDGPDRGHLTAKVRQQTALALYSTLKVVPGSVLL